MRLYFSLRELDGFHDLFEGLLISGRVFFDRAVTEVERQTGRVLQLAPPGEVNLGVTAHRSERLLS